MKLLTRRALIALLVTICVAVGLAAPASAGTLTGATFTAPVGWTTAGAKNTRYDWGFTTATSSTVSKVTASVPAGTGGSNRYLALSGATGSNSASTPDSLANSVTGAIDLRARIQPASWSPVSAQTIISKWDHSGGQGAIEFNQNAGGGLTFWYSPDGIAVYEMSSTVAVGAAANTAKWVRAAYRPDNGAGQRTVEFYVSDDGTTWSQLGATASASGVLNLFDNGAPWTLGKSPDEYNHMDGRIYYAEVRDGVNGTVVNRFDPNEAAPQTPSSWASSTGETWTVNRSGTNLPADIATDLTVGPVEGLPSGGTANYRFIDGVATYNLPVATAIPAGRTVKLNLGGFTNTATPGSYTSLIRTYDNSGPPPAIVDSATTGALTFTGSESTTAASAVVDPSLTLTLAGMPTSCSGTSPTAGTSSTGSAVNLGRIDATSSAIANQTVTLATNGANGALVYVRAPNAMASTGGHSLAGLASSSYVAGLPFPAAGTEAFGMRMDWWPAGVWASFATSNVDQYYAMGSPGFSVGCISMRAQAGPTTPAGFYSTTVIYTAVGRY